MCTASAPKRRRIEATIDNNSALPSPAQEAEVLVLLHVNARVALRRHRFAFGNVSPEQARTATAQQTSAILGYDQDGNEITMLLTSRLVSFFNLS